MNSSVHTNPHSCCRVSLRECTTVDSSYQTSSNIAYMSGLHLVLDVDCRYCYIILQTATLPHTSNLRSLVKKASVIKRKMSTKSKISVKMSDDGCGHNRDSGKIFRSALTLSILERNHLCLWRRRKSSTMRIPPVINTCPMCWQNVLLYSMRLPGGGHKRFPHLLPSLKPRDGLRGEDSSFEQEMEVRSSLRHCLMLDVANSRRLIVSRSILRWWGQSVKLVSLWSVANV